jgi:hypothetical protein
MVVHRVKRGTVLKVPFFDSAKRGDLFDKTLPLFSEQIVKASNPRQLDGEVIVLDALIGGGNNVRRRRGDGDMKGGVHADT